MKSLWGRWAPLRGPTDIVPIIQGKPRAVIFSFIGRGSPIGPEPLLHCARIWNVDRASPVIKRSALGKKKKRFVKSEHFFFWENAMCREFLFIRLRSMLGSVSPADTRVGPVACKDEE